MGTCLFEKLLLSNGSGILIKNLLPSQRSLFRCLFRGLCLEILDIVSERFSKNVSANMLQNYLQILFKYIDFKCGITLQNVPPKHYYLPTELHDAPTEKTTD
jgi:hypothetical protein